MTITAAVAHQAVLWSSKAWATRCRQPDAVAAGRTEHRACPLLWPVTADVPASAPGTVGHSSQTSRPAAGPARCHQLAGSAAEDRTCHHCTAAKPNTTTTGRIRTRTARTVELWLATAALFDSSATTPPKTTTHPVRPAS